MPTIDEIQDALERPPGRRAFHPDVRAALADINHGTFIAPSIGRYLHAGRGGFAVVYRVRTPDGRERALRCWTSPPAPDTQERLAATGAYLASLPVAPAGLVPIRYVPNALCLPDGNWPVTVMDWVEGVSLFDAVEKNLANPAYLAALAEAVRERVMALQATQIAHGDLQHDNILVRADGQLVLIDYDTLFVPAMTGRACPILGLEGYVHPALFAGRISRQFHPNMDSFAALVLVVSLRALACDPGLFRRFTQEKILFRQDDLMDPAASEVFQAVRQLPDADVQRLAAILANLCQEDILPDAPLAAFLGIGRRTLRPTPPARFRAPTLPQRPPAWVPGPPAAPGLFRVVMEVTLE